MSGVRLRMKMSKHVSNDPLERLVARLVDSEILESSFFFEPSSGDPLERLSGWIAAARDLSMDSHGAPVEGVLGELLERIESARIIEPLGSLDFGESDLADPSARIAMWIEEERVALGSMPAIVRVRAVGGGLSDRGIGEQGERLNAGVDGLEAVVGRAVLSMVGEMPLSAKSRRKAVELLAVALEQPSPHALQAAFRILIAGE